MAHADRRTYSQFGRMLKDAFYEGAFPNGLPTPTPLEVLNWIDYNDNKKNTPIAIPGVSTFIGSAIALLAVKKGIRIQNAAGPIAAGVAIDLLPSCAPSPTSNETKPPAITPTNAQIQEVTQQALATATAIPPTEAPTPAPKDLEQPIRGSIASPIKGLAFGQLKFQDQEGKEVITTIGTVKDYPTTPINTLYKIENSKETYAFGIDQKYLQEYFAATQTEEGIVGTVDGQPNGKKVILKGTVWEEVETGKIFIPYSLAKDGCLVINANKQVQHVDLEGKVMGAPEEMFQNPQEIALRAGFKGDVNQIETVEFTRGGALAIVSQIQQPTQEQPDKVIKIVEDADYIFPAEDLRKNEMAMSAVDDFAIALTKQGITRTIDELNQGIVTMRIEGSDSADHKQKDITVITIEQQQKRINYPILIKNETGEWEEANWKTQYPVTGFGMGTSISTDEEGFFIGSDGLNHYDGKEYFGPYHAAVKKMSTLKVVGTLNTTLVNWPDTPKYILEAVKNSELPLYLADAVFWHMDQDPSFYISGKPNDPSKSRGVLRNDITKDEVVNSMDKRLRSILSLVKKAGGGRIDIMVEPIYYFNEQIGWENDALYQAFGENKFAEAYIMAYERAKSIGLEVGKDVIFEYADYGIETNGKKTQYVVEMLKKSKLEIYNRLNSKYPELTSPDAVPLDVGIEFHVTTEKNQEAGPNTIGGTSLSKLSPESIGDGIMLLQTIGAVHIVEGVIHSKDYEVIRKALLMISDTAKNNGVKDMIFYQSLRKSLDRGLSHVLFDEEYKPTIIYHELMSKLLGL